MPAESDLITNQLWTELERLYVERFSEPIPINAKNIKKIKSDNIQIKTIKRFKNG
jgi:hypothetical protein